MKEVLDGFKKIDKKDFLYIPDFLKQANQVLEKLSGELRLSYSSIRIFGKQIKEPRSTEFYGDPGISYKYSGETRQAEAWSPSLLEIKNLLSLKNMGTYNTCLVNHYKNGQEYMGWHRDNEPELGDKPLVACISLGSERDFQFRDEQTTYEINLKNGSLFLMKNSFQETYKHQIPKRKKIDGVRLSLTFRLVNSNLKK